MTHLDKNSGLNFQNSQVSKRLFVCLFFLRGTSFVPRLSRGWNVTYDIKPPISGPPYEAPHFKPPTISSPPYQAPHMKPPISSPLQYQAPHMKSPHIRPLMLNFKSDLPYQAPTYDIKPLVLDVQNEAFTYDIKPCVGAWYCMSGPDIVGRGLILWVSYGW